jgi:hypothetical protein
MKGTSIVDRGPRGPITPTPVSFAASSGAPPSSTPRASNFYRDFWTFHSPLWEKKMSDKTCPDCGETYRNSAGHDCPGSPEDRLTILENRIEQIEERLENLIGVLQNFFKELPKALRSS